MPNGASSARYGLADMENIRGVIRPEGADCLAERCVTLLLTPVNPSPASDLRRPKAQLRLRFRPIPIIRSRRI